MDKNENLPNNEEFTIQITPSAIDYISSSVNKSTLEQIAVVLVDTHCCGGTFTVEIQKREKTKEDLHLVELFPPKSRNYEFSIWVEHQALREFSVPEQILLDLNPYSKPPRLEVKNGRFEEPY
ncbi:hypothetical protein [Candidatus Harpocratesius sp.]